MTRQAVCFEDKVGNRLEVRIEHNTNTQTWLVYLYHLPLGEFSRTGVRRAYPREGQARQAWQHLEDTVKDLGWKLHVVEHKQDWPPAPMKMDDDGRRLFRDHITDQYRLDESSFTPPGAVVAEYNPECQESDNFSEVFAPSDHGS